MCLNARDIVRITNETFHEKDDLHRYASWDYCYGLAQCMYSRRDALEDYDYDLMALSLAFYLASWGMYRGSSSLLKRSYKIHIEPLRLLFGNDQLWHNPIPSQVLVASKASLTQAYGSGLNNMTETLFTKILLGLTGNVIACDGNCKEALNYLGFDGKLLQQHEDGSTSWDELRESGYFDTIADALENENLPNAKYPVVEYQDGRYIQTDVRKGYPRAKLVDMFLFSLGKRLIEKGSVEMRRPEER